VKEWYCLRITRPDARKQHSVRCISRLERERVMHRDAHNALAIAALIIAGWEIGPM
jgi:hypothetical protein